MRILILGDLGNVHIQKMCQWLVDHDVDVLPMSSMDPEVIKYKIAQFEPYIIHAFGAYTDVAAKIDFGHLLTAEHAPKCVDTSKFKPGYSPFRNTFAKTPDTKVILVPNHMTPEYNYDTILEAFKLILKDYPDSTLVFHNPGEDMVYQEKIVKLTEELGLDEHVFSNGYVQYIRMPQIYNAADVICVIPALEKISATILEAMACEKPVITADNTTNHKLIPNNWCIDVKDYKALAHVLDEILAKRYTKEWLGKGRETIKYLYEQDMWMDMMLDNCEMEMRK
jgi:glycosyltransferase involved in cell wall biosynthesis